MSSCHLGGLHENFKEKVGGEQRISVCNREKVGMWTPLAKAKQLLVRSSSVK